MSGTSKFFLPALISVGSLIGLCPASAAPASAPSDTPSPGLEEIVVTAQKRNEDLQKVSLAVSAITGNALKESGVFDAQGLTDMVPSLEVGQNNSNTTFAIRGISSTTDATLGDAAVAFHLDGVFEGRPAAASGLFYDIQRVEVLRGPQGTLYGRNATAGAINVVTNRPNFDGYEGEGTVETGNYNEIRTEAMINAPVTSTLAVRAAMQTLHHGAYLSDGYDDAEDHAARLQALWRPNDDVSLLVGGDYFHQGGVGTGLTQLNRANTCDWNQSSPTYVGNGGAGYANGLPCVLSTGRLGPWASWSTTGMTSKGYESPPGWTDNLSWGVHAELTWNLGPMVLTEIPAYHHLNVRYFALGNGLDNSQNDRDRETSNELRLSSNADSRLKWVAGLFYHNEEHSYRQVFYDNVAGALGIKSCAGVAVQSATGNPDCAAPGDGVSLVFPYPKISNPSYAGFGELTYPVTDDWRLTGGVRWNRDHKRVIGETDRVYGLTLPTGSPDFAYAVPAVNFGHPVSSIYAGQTIYPGASELAIRTNADVTWTKATWKAGIEHDLTDRNMAYLNVSTGYKQGGVFAGAVGLNTYQPETLTAYEIGAKNRFLNNRLQINVDAFYYNYKNYQVDQLENLPVGNGTFAFGDDIFNAEKATEFGAELESRWAVTETDVLNFNLAYLHAKFDKFLFPIQADPSKPFITDVTFADLSGTSPTSAPQLTGTFSYLHTVQLSSGSSLQMMLQTHAESAYWLAVDHNIDPVKEMGSRQRGYTRSQAVVTYYTADSKFSVQAFVRNIENKAVMNTFSYGGDGPAYASVAPPRTYGIAVGAHF